MPLISVIIPVYNGEKFLKASIDSVLNQEFTDFECIIINDGSTDSTDQIIRSYTDPRIRYTMNEGNKGIVYTLNRGIDLARGEWIARMDADDICLPDRFSTQLAYMQQHPYVDVLATTVTLINEEDQPIGVWEDDKRYVRPAAIYQQLPKNNCISHPTILAKTETLRSYRYRSSQQGSEDYDLWLRLLASGKQIHKLAEPYLLHRIVKTSITRNRQKNVFAHLLQTKRTFLFEAKDSGYDKRFLNRVFWFAHVDLIKSKLKAIKNKYVVSAIMP